MVCEKGTSEEDIEKDITTKWMIINSIGEESQKII